MTLNPEQQSEFARRLEVAELSARETKAQLELTQGMLATALKLAGDMQELLANGLRRRQDERLPETGE